MPATPGREAAATVLLLLCALPQLEGLLRVAAVRRPGDLHSCGVSGPGHAQGRPGWWRIEVESCVNLRGGGEGDTEKKKGGKWWEDRRRGASEAKSGERGAPAPRGGVRGGAGIGYRGTRGGVSPWSPDAQGGASRGKDQSRFAWRGVAGRGAERRLRGGERGGWGGARGDSARGGQRGGREGGEYGGREGLQARRGLDSGFKVEGFGGDACLLLQECVLPKLSTSSSC